MRRKKLLSNTITAFLNQIITLINGLIVPRLIISHYGSATNGLVSSITQFLAFFSLMEMGVGGVVRASLYKPLAENDPIAVSRVLISSKRFFTKIGLLLCVYSVGLMIFFPLAVDDQLGFFSTALLVGAIAFSSVTKYMLGTVYQQLLNADQRAYVHLSINILITVLSTAFSVILIQHDARIENVKLLAAFIMLLRPLLMKLYVDRHYDIDLRLPLEGEPLTQKWNGLAQHIAQYILKHSDTVVLTLFSSLENVSVYYVYHLVTNGLQQIVEISSTGIGALFGNMYAKNEKETLQRTFSAVEWVNHTLVSFLYGVAGVLILPFVEVYTKGISDTNYIVPLFSSLMVIANASYCLRIPYLSVVNSAGHFKETQASAITEAALNVVISVLLVSKFGLVGVAFGTVAAMMYRTIYLSLYLRNNILFRPFSAFAKHIAVDVLTVAIIVLSTRGIRMTQPSWIMWCLTAVKVSLIAGCEVLIINLIFYRKLMEQCVLMLFRKKKKTV